MKLGGGGRQTCRRHLLVVRGTCQVGDCSEKSLWDRGYISWARGEGVLCSGMLRDLVILPELLGHSECSNCREEWRLTWLTVYSVLAYIVEEVW